MRMRNYAGRFGMGHPKETRDQRIERLMSKVTLPDAPDGCWTWNASVTNGYGMFRCEMRLLMAHRASFQIFVGEIPAGQFVRHRCRTATCVRPDHLFLSPTCGVRDGRNRGNRLTGSKRPRVSVQARSAIQERFRLGASRRSLAREFGFSESTIRRVVSIAQQTS